MERKDPNPHTLPTAAHTNPGAEQRDTNPRSLDFVEDFWGLEDLDVATQRAYSAPDEEVVELFEKQFSRMFLGAGGTGVFVPSGREALRLILTRVRKAGRPFVTVPTYCCKAVGEAILRAGLTPLLVDSGPTPGTLDWDQWEASLRTEKVAAAILVYHFGMPIDAEEGIEIARRTGTVLIEDCASCLGATVRGRLAGSLGEWSLFSFNYSKPLCLGGGGMLVSNSTDARARACMDEIRTEQRRKWLKPQGEFDELREFRRQVEENRTNIAYLPPSRFGHAKWVARRVLGRGFWLLRWGLYRFGIVRDGEDEYPGAVAVGPVRAALGSILADRYCEVLERRRQNYTRFRQRMTEGNFGEVLTPGDGIEPAWLSTKLTLPGMLQSEVDALVRFLCSEGYSVGQYLGRTLDQQPNLMIKARRAGTLNNAHRILESSLDLPVHQNMTTQDVDRMADLLQQWLACHGIGDRLRH